MKYGSSGFSVGDPPDVGGSLRVFRGRTAAWYSLWSAGIACTIWVDPTNRLPRGQAGEVLCRRPEAPLKLPDQGR